MDVRLIEKRIFKVYTIFIKDVGTKRSLVVK